MENISEGLMGFKVFEKTIFTIMCRVGCELISEYLDVCDRQVLAMRDTEEYRFINFGTTTVKTLMGEVSYTRRCYRKKSGGHIFLLDEAIGLGGNFGLVSENLAEEIAILCSEQSFRKAAGSISGLTGQCISAMGAWNIFQQFGKRIEGQEGRLQELAQADVVGQLGNVSSPVLFEEFDDIWLPMQREKRCKLGGGPAEVGRKKAGKKPIHIGTAYTGWRQAKDGRYNTIDKLSYASFGSVPEFVSSFEALKRHRFDMDGLEYRVMNGDGAAWIKAVAEDSDSILQLDPFHRSRAVLRAISDKDDQSVLFGAINAKDVDKALTVITGLISRAGDEVSRKKLTELYSFFYNNKDTLLTWQERGIELPPPPEGVAYRNLGVQESSNCDLLTQRMKHRKGSWSVTGGSHMAKILCFRHTIGLGAILGLLPGPPLEAPAKPLSSSKAPQCDGKGYDSALLHIGMPFEQAFKTNGRKAVREMLKQRPPADLRFI